MRKTVLIVLLLALWPAALSAQESALGADFRREGERFHEACGSFSFKAAAGCAVELFTDHPLHIAVGSIAPQNGFGFGGAFVTHYTPNESWRLSWNFDAVASGNASWRAGGYMKMIHTPVETLHAVTPTAAKPGEKPPKLTLAVHPYTVFNIYAQSSSLNKLNFFGLGPNTVLLDKSIFGMQETIVGGNAIKPVYEWAAIRKLNLALLGELNGRFVSLRGNHGESSPSIEQLYSEATAPGLASQPGFVQLGEGVRIKPGLFDDHLQLNYLASFQQFFAPSNSHYSFLRWTVDLNHSIPLYGHTQSPGAAKDTNGPDECAVAVGAEKCPSLSTSRNLAGSIGLRLLVSESINSASSAVPFYFQQTLGGSDISGNPSLTSFQDYRFRAPNIFLLRESFEHSIWGPFGFVFMADQGKVALTRGDIGFEHMKHSFAAGITLRGAGFPFVSLMYAWGGGEGQHTVFNVNNSLLGGSSRPFLD